MAANPATATPAANAAAATAAPAPAASDKATDKAQDKATAKEADGWCAMESNPEVLTRFLHNLGVAKNFGFTDILGLDAELLAMLPPPVVAVVLLFPMPDSNAATSDAAKANAAKPADAKAADAKAADAKAADAKAADAKAADAKAGAKATDAKAADAGAAPFFVIQTPELGNACGTVASLHAVFNTESILNSLAADSPVRDFMAQAKALSSVERGKLLSGFKSIKAKHDAHVVQGQTHSSGDAEEDTEHHFVVFVPFAGKLYELDGMQSAPVLHATADGHAVTGDTFVADAAAAIQRAYIGNPKFGSSVSFSLLALTAAIDA